MTENPKSLQQDQITQEVCLMHKISNAEVEDYRTLLEKRIEQIEAVIDQYFEQIKPQLIKKKITKLETKGFEFEEENLREEFKKYDFSQKLVQIAKFEEVLLDK